MNVAQCPSPVRRQCRLDEEVDSDTRVCGGRAPPLTGRIPAFVRVECETRSTETIREGLVETGGQKLDIEAKVEVHRADMRFGDGCVRVLRDEKRRDETADDDDPIHEIAEFRGHVEACGLRVAGGREVVAG